MYLASSINGVWLQKIAVALHVFNVPTIFSQRLASTNEGGRGFRKPCGLGVSQKLLNHHFPVSPFINECYDSI